MTKKQNVLGITAREKIRAFIRDNSRLTLPPMQVIADAIGAVSTDTVYYHLGIMAENGEVKPPDKKGGRWELVK